MRIANIFLRLFSYHALFVVTAGFTFAMFITSGPLVSADDTYARGEHIELAFEGWRKKPDGTFGLMFGYMNENWEEELDISVGENNFFSPGELDRGQPTHFLPRRNRFTFEVIVPADWGDRELVWTLTSNGKTRKVYASLLSDYIVDNQVIASETGSLSGGFSSPESRSNTAPVAVVQGDKIRSVRVGEPLVLITQVSDDGLPKTRALTHLATRQPLLQRMMRPPRNITVNKFNGLFNSWAVYRGVGNVSFDPPQIKLWEDTRPAANSPWGSLWKPPEVPEDGLYTTTVTFDQPGSYVLWGRTDDGALYADNYITVNVSP